MRIMIEMKRKISVLLILLIVALSLFGCGGDKDTDTDDSSATGSSITAEKTTDEAIATEEAVATENAVKDGKTDNSAEKKSSSADEKAGSSSDSTSGKNSTKKKDATSDTKEETIKCTVSIDCTNLYKKDPDLAQKVSNKGVILVKKSFSFKAQSTVYDALKATGLSFAGKKYISQINGLSEKDGGKLSGWMYLVNGKVPLESCDEYILKNGDYVQWRYTCNNGEDI